MDTAVCLVEVGVPAPAPMQSGDSAEQFSWGQRVFELPSCRLDVRFFSVRRGLYFFSVPVDISTEYKRYGYLLIKMSYVQDSRWTKTALAVVITVAKKC